MNARTLLVAGSPPAHPGARLRAARPGPQRGRPPPAGRAGRRPISSRPADPWPLRLLRGPDRSASRRSVGRSPQRMKQLGRAGARPSCSREADRDRRPRTRRSTGRSATLDQATLQQRAPGAAGRVSATSRSAPSCANEELKQTQHKAVQRDEQELEPDRCSQLYPAARCAILLEPSRRCVAVVNPAMDLSGQAVDALDARIQTARPSTASIWTPKRSAQPAAAR